MAEPAALHHELRRRRAAGDVFVWCASHARGENAEQAVRDFLRGSPSPLDIVDDLELDELEPIDVETARRLLANVLRFDLASQVELLDQASADRLAGEVIEALAAPVRWWTNGTVGLPGTSGGWTPLTDAPYDTGVIGVSRDQVLVVWFTDED